MLLKLLVELEVEYSCDQHQNNTPQIGETNLLQNK